ncbi:MAG: ribonucleotide reductase subunit alpha [Polaromonas sp.]|nr:ribonucleotide reductase subunit alpha [Polaromonas sp.]
MNITNFDDLLLAARAQPTPQRLLFVFAGIELPADATAAQRASFERGEGGALVPLMCVDKSPDDIQTFEELTEEAAAFGKPWGMVFASAMSGPLGLPPRSEDADEPLKLMVDAIKQGQLNNLIPFNPRGQAVRLG